MDWEFLWNEYINSYNVEDNLDILSSLSCSKNTTLLRK